MWLCCGSCGYGRFVCGTPRALVVGEVGDPRELTRLSGAANCCSGL